MATKSLPSLKSYPKACLKAEENADLFSELPEEILVSIMSSFTIEDAARFSLVSRQCERTWRYFPVLIFKDYHSKEKFWDSWEAIVEEKACFVRSVDRVLEKHLGTTIDEFRIIFDLELSSQSYVDKWVAVALDKQVKRLELDFQSNLRKMHVRDSRSHRPLPICFDLPPKFTGFKSLLTSLCVRYVNVTNEFVDYLPLSCPLLEILCIQGSRYLTRITGSLHVKQLEVSYCRNLEKIDVSARKLLSLTLNFVYPIELHIVDAPSLFKMSIGEAKILPHAFDNLSDILSQLVYLNLRFCLILPLMRGLVNGVPMPKLRHLELTVTCALIDSSLYQCIFVIQACPSLEKLTLKLERFIVRTVADRQPRKWIGCGFPLKCLKTLELVGYRGIAMDLELAFFVLDYASMLEEIIVDFVPLNDNDKRQRLVMLQMKLPQGVKLTVK
ncbi:putative FBD-associated F-box protein At1g61330 [Silene latifolia]|uniref:putative FBD-associated F-box protein At1g61330 n=1 Tax=Silene latifolia TaxID=37657 RepID=UPI003D78354C